VAANGYDTIVIGGGIIGGSIAWRLAQAGQKVVVLERGHVGREASFAAAGVLTPKFTSDHSANLIDFWASSNALYPSYVDEIKAATGDAFEYRRSGHIIPSFSEDETTRRRIEFEEQGPAGIPASWLSRDDTLALEPLLAPEVEASVYYPDHGFVDNPKLTNALGGAVRAAGGEIVENCLVTGLTIEGDAVVGVETAIGPIRGQSVVNCAGSWAGMIDHRSTMPIRPLKGEILAVDLRPTSLHILVSGVGCSAVPRADGRTIVCATSSHAGYNKDVVFGSVVGLFEKVARLLPALRTGRFVETWAGLRPITPDGEPIMGADPQLRGLFWATGHWGNGILAAPLTGRTMADLILTGKTSFPIEQFSPGRFAPVAVGAV
jgi:glycine oxidase